MTAFYFIDTQLYYTKSNITEKNNKDGSKHKCQDIGEEKINKQTSLRASCFAAFGLLHAATNCYGMDLLEKKRTAHSIH
jgi:hypothetical protein